MQPQTIWQHCLKIYKQRRLNAILQLTIKMWQVFTILILLSCSSLDAHTKKCNDLLRELASAQSLFVQCTTNHAVPVKVCIECANEYLDMTTNFAKLMAIENCSKMYTDSDRINVVATTQGVLTGLWSRANCDDCFNSNNSIVFEQKAIDLTTCLGLNKGSECTNCDLQYLDLNDFYKDIERKCTGKVCYDLQDSMNRTRLHWSKELNCCKREVHMTTFIVSAGIVALLPLLLFYSSVYVLTKRREANHSVLNENYPELATPSTSMLITAAVLSTTTPAEDSSLIQAREEKVANILAAAEDSSDDDLPLIKQN